MSSKVKVSQLSTMIDHDDHDKVHDGLIHLRDRSRLRREFRASQLWNSNQLESVNFCGAIVHIKYKKVMGM
jgi:hypothetical protein